MRRNLYLIPLAFLFTACGDVDGDGDDHGDDHEDGEDHEHDDEAEVISRVVMTLTDGSGKATEVTWDEDDAGTITADDITLTSGTTYDVSVAFLNAFENPVADITEEIEDEAEEHQVFFTGDAVMGPASDVSGAPLTHSYDDTDANGYPIGLANTLEATAAGTGTLTVTLRHLPPESGEDVKLSDLAATVAAEGFSGIGGENDLQVDFSVTVQ